MRAKVKRPFRDIKTGRKHKRNDVITISKSRFEELSFFLDEAGETEQLTPKRDSDGNCIPCKKKK